MSLKSIKRKILTTLSEKAILNPRPGPIIQTHAHKKITPKQRRHRGWRTPRIDAPSMKFKEMVDNAFEPLPQYDDWKDFRDGMRDTRDKTKIIPKHPRRRYGWWGMDDSEIIERNSKLKRLEKIKQAKRKSKKK